MSEFCLLLTKCLVRVSSLLFIRNFYAIHLITSKMNSHNTANIILLILLWTQLNNKKIIILPNHFLLYTVTFRLLDHSNYCVSIDTRKGHQKNNKISSNVKRLFKRTKKSVWCQNKDWHQVFCPTLDSPNLDLTLLNEIH